MECYYHPEREGADQCAICGKSICKECGLEIAGKIYCKECLEKIVGLSMDNAPKQESEPAAEKEPIKTEPTISEVIDESIYQQPEKADDIEIPYAPQEEVSAQGISEDSPYNIKSNIEYSGGLESSYMDDAAQSPQPQVAQNEYDIAGQETLKPQGKDEDFIYPDHSFEPEVTTARQDLEDKYERYLDDLYFDENEVPLTEQLAKDEAQYGSLTRREYAPRKEEAIEQQTPSQRKAPKQETPEEMEARLRSEILKEQGMVSDKEDKNIHNLNYQDEKEPMGIIDILLTIVLVIVILIVIYYLIYLFLLSTTYPTFMDAVFALKNPQNVINGILTH